MSSDAPSTVLLHAAMLTDVGVVRDHNEDSAHIDPEHQFFVVADGMGGHAAGEVASAMAVDKVREVLEDSRKRITAFAEAPDDEHRKDIIKILENAVRIAHESVYETGSREKDKHGMGTTLDVVLIAGAEAFVAHVGDSRTYLVRDGRATQITTDHTVAEVLVIEGKLSLEEAQISPLRTILVNAIGVAPEVGIEMTHLQLRKGDQLLLCSDGLHDYFPVEQELADYISSSAPEDALTDLIELAKERGGHDNITGIVVLVQHGGEADTDVDEGTDEDEPGVPDELEKDDTLPVEERAAAEDDTLPVAKQAAEEDGESSDEGEPGNPSAEGKKRAKKRKSSDGADGKGAKAAGKGNASDELGDEFGAAMVDEPTLEHERPRYAKPDPRDPKARKSPN